MDIQYMQMLRDNPEQYPGDLNFTGRIKPLSLEEIIGLEQKWNNGKVFPKALRELLYLAGKYCYVSEKFETYGKNQAMARYGLEKYNHQINRPFFVFDICHNGIDEFLYIHLDEGDNPYVYTAFISSPRIEPFSKIEGGLKLTEYINKRIEIAKRGGSLS